MTTRVRRHWGIGLVAVLALTIAACGDDDDGSTAPPDTSGPSDTTASTTRTTTASGPTTTSPAGQIGASTSAAPTTAPSDVDPQGVVRIPISLESVGGVQLDPADTVVNSDEAWIFAIYGTLLRESQSGSLDPWLAKSVEILDPQNIKVVLNEGVKFSDGTPYDAAAVRRGMLRNLNEPGSPGVASGRNYTFPQLEDIVVDAPLELTFRLKAPLAGEFLQVLAGREAAVPSPKSLDDGLDPSASPVGAGPFVFKEFRPSELLSVRKSPTFFQADRWQVGGIDWMQATGEAVANGLLSQQTDFGQVAQAQLAPFEANNTYETATVDRDFDYYLINFCRTQPPFDDIRVRQAVQAGINREALSQSWLAGAGDVAYGFWPEGHPNFAPGSKQYNVYAPDRARQLLAEAGATDVSFDLVQPYQATPNFTRLAEILQAQLDEVGITANIVFTPNIVTDFIQAQKPGALMNPGSRPGTDRVARIFAPGAQQVLCGAPDEEITAWMNQIAALRPNDPQVPALYAQIDEKMQSQAFVVFLVKNPIFYVWNSDNIGGTPVFSGQKGLIQFDTFYVKR